MTTGACAGSVQPVAVAGCLGWLHLPPEGGASGRGVLICAPAGYEALAAYRGLYDLAARCAAAGLPALRFDYPGSGDSPGEEGPGHVEACRVAIGEAAEWLLRHAGVTQLALCGLRLGALLAAQAAARRPGRFADLALLAPVASGRAHVRQLRLMAQTGTGSGTEPGDWLEAGGELLHRLDLEDLAAADLAAAIRAARPRRILLLERRPALGDRLSGAAEVTALPFEGAEAFFAPSHMARLPGADFSRVAAWLAQDAPPAAAGIRLPGVPLLPIGAGVTERPLRFGRGNGLAGVLCAPEARQRRRVAVLLLNTGANPRAGVGRFGVRLARRLAELGFCSLRMDAAGLGDSEAPPDMADPDIPADMFRDALIGDAQAGLDVLAAQDVPRCLVVGICAGAHVAFQLALRDRRVDGVALFNLPAFDRAAGGAPALDGGPPPGEIPLLRRPRMLLRRLRATCDMALATWFEVESGLDRPGRWMRELSARGTRVLLAYSARDRGLRELRAHFGRGGRSLAGLGTVRRVVLDGTDHSLAPLAMQRQAIGLVEEEALRLDLAAAQARQPIVAGNRAEPALPLPQASMPAG